MEVPKPVYRISDVIVDSGAGVVLDSRELVDVPVPEYQMPDVIVVSGAEVVVGSTPVVVVLTGMSQVGS